MTVSNIKPKQVTKRLLAALPERARDVLINRYGLGKDTDTKTLEAIGNIYGISRERVRQIENYALSSIHKSDAFREEQETFEKLSALMDDMGALVPEGYFLEHISNDKSIQNHVYFLLVLGESFVKRKEDADFHRRWYVNKDVADRIHRALQKLYKSLSDEDLIPEAELVNRFLDEVKDLNERYRSEEVARRWLSLSKNISKNPLGEWGVAHSSNVRAKGMRDYAYLTIKRHGSPMHFTEVAKAITELFNRKAHVATCHNELIKDPRFVLVGRGLYALSEWGYSAGVVKDVIRDILRKHGALTRDEIIDHVRKERYVKDNTILVNLQDSAHFGKDEAGRYILVA